MKMKYKLVIILLAGMITNAFFMKDKVLAKNVENNRLMLQQRESNDEYYTEKTDGCFKYRVYETECSIVGFCQKYTSSGTPVYKKIVIPEKYKGLPVEGISREAFAKHKEITSVTVKGNQLKVIGWMAFSGCKGLKKITIPESVMEVYDAFQGCTNLKKVIFKGIPDQISDHAFSDTKWVKECRKKGVPAISNKILIDGTGMKGDVEIKGKKVEYIVNQAFRGNKKITSLKISGVERIGYMAFKNTGIKSVYVNDVKEMGSWMFSGCKKLKKATIKNVSIIQDGALAGCLDLREVQWGIDIIPEQTFRSCTKLKKIWISTQKEIIWPEAKWGVDAFAGCENTYVYLSSSQISESISNLSAKMFVFYVPEDAVEKCQQLTGCEVIPWKE